MWNLIRTPALRANKTRGEGVGNFGERPCAVFEYVGPPMDAAEAEMLMTAKA
jgi:hypothetical protein